MTDTDFALADGGPDDLPRTLRREREARERAKREEEERKLKGTRTHDFEPAVVAPSSYTPRPAGFDATPAVVKRFEVPFLHLMAFFIKAVVAAIPAIVLLGVLLWFAGAAIKSAYPQLIHTEVVIRVPR